MSRFIKILLVLSCGLQANFALAKKDKRQGVNFGAGLRLLDSYDSRLASKDSTKKSEVSSRSTAVTPYLGYAFLDTFNIGISTLFESEGYQENINDTEHSSKLERTTTSDLRAANLFIRFLFARFMYFEGGFGFYDRRAKISDESTSDATGGAFNGKREEYRQRGVGLGYHVGGGIETPLVNGFYFTTNYLVRNFVLRNHEGDNFGEKQSSTLKRELTFGIAHYVD